MSTIDEAHRRFILEMSDEGMKPILEGVMSHVDNRNLEACRLDCCLLMGMLAGANVRNIELQETIAQMRAHLYQIKVKGGKDGNAEL